MPSLGHYFANSIYDDIYLIALDKMLDAQDFVVAIIPETFINSSFRRKDKLDSITILEENPFEDTDTPVCVACFDNKTKPRENVLVYKNSHFVSNLFSIESLRLFPQNKVPIVFNDKNGWLALRGVDSTSSKNRIRFDYKEKIKYNWDKGLKVSSRHVSLIKIDVCDTNKDRFIEEVNRILNEIRENSADIILSPFKGNTKEGKRRRRLDFSTARAILEAAYIKIETKQQSLF
jgi:hypothetical protein